MADLYEVLGVARDANTATIRRAFRRKARSSHPDGGGSVEAFNELKGAYDILSDPVRRRHYDETGKYEAPELDPHQARIVELLAHAVDQALSRLSNGSPWRDADFLAMTKQTLIDAQSDAVKAMLRYENTLEQSRMLRNRFRVSDGNNLMEMVIERRIITCQRMIDQLSDRIRMIKEASAVLANTTLESLPELIGIGSSGYSSEIASLLDHSGLVGVP